MAPSTALLLLLNAATLIGVWFCFASWRLRAVAYGVAALTGVVGALVLLRTWLGWNSPVEQWLAQGATPLGQIPRGEMSPVSGALFLLVAVVLALRLPPLGRRTGVRVIAALFSIVIVGLGLGVLVGQNFGYTLTLGAVPIPMAFPTAIAFCLLGLALLAYPPPAVVTPSPAPAPHKTASLPLTLLLLLALLVGAFSAAYLRHDQVQRRADAWQLLSSIADLKAAEIQHWRADHWNVVHYLAGEQVFVEAARDALRNPENKEARALVLRRFEQLATDKEFSLVALFDSNAVARLTLPAQSETPPVLGANLVASMAREPRLSMADLHFDAAQGNPHLGLAFPILAEAATNAPVAGYVLARLDPQPFLFPLIQSWPTPSATAETVLVRREGNDVLFLNDVRGQTNAALRLRLPLASHERVPAVMAVLGRTGQVEGVDYRDEPVLAAIRPIENSHWFLIAKLDRAELFAPLRQQALLTLLLALALTGLAGFAFWLLRKQREVRIVTNDLTLERERRAMAERVEVLMKSANDIILVMDARWRIVEANDRAVQSYGYTREALLQLPLYELRPVAARADFAAQNARLEVQGSVTFETVHQRKDGTTFPVEVSARLIAQDGVSYRIGIVRDIGERKAHEREIARLTRLYAMLSQINQSIVRVTSREELFREVCRVTAEFSGFSLAWIGWLDPATHEIVPVGSAGDDKGYLDKIKVFADERPEGQGPCGLCLREDRAIVFNDFIEDERALPWRSAALVHGLRAMMALPLRLEGQVCGTFAVYADEPAVFQDKERALLEEAALDISFALDNLAHATQHQQTDVALRESEARFQQMVSSIEDVLYSVDGRSGAFLYLSPAFEKMLGYTPADIAQFGGREKFLAQVIQQEQFAQQQQVFHQLQAGLTTAPLTHWESWWRCKDGSLKYVEDHWFPSRDSMGLCSTNGVLRDATARKRAEEALRESEERFRALFGHMAEGVALHETVYDEHGVPANYRLIEVNASYEKIIGLQRERVVGRLATEVYGGDSAPFLKEYAAVGETGRPTYLEIYFEPLRKHFAISVAPWGPGRWATIFTDITERKQAEAILRESEERFRAALEFLPIPISIANSLGQIQYCNQAFIAHYGYTPVDTPTMEAWLVRAYPDADYRQSVQTQWEADLALALRQGCATPLRLYHVTCKNGERRDVEITMRASGNLFIASFNDITERKQAVAAMQQSEEQFRTTFEMASIGMAQADPHNGRFLRVNQKMCAITGYSEEELLKMRVRDVTHPEDREADGKMFQRVIRGSQPDYQIEKRYIRKDGAQIWVNINMTVLRSAHGRPLRTMATIEDITARKAAAETLRQNEERYRSLFENMLNGFAYCQVLFDADGRPCDFVYLAVNKAFETQTGLKEVTGRKVSEVIPGILEADPQLIATYGRVALTGLPEHIEVYVEALRMWFAISLYSPRKDHFVAVFDVITERKRLEEEREITVHLLGLLNSPNNLHELMRQVTLLLHDWFDCEAVGIRLREGEDYPYYETHGFPAEFVQLEKNLCHCDADGHVERDADGRPVLECMCGNVLCGRCDPAQPFFTARGSFWSNDTTRLLATTSDADRQAHTRNRCNGEGYESVALVALRAGTITYGLLQVNDKRKNRFTPERIALLERLADSIAIGIAHRQAQTQLRENEERYRTLFDCASDAVFVHPMLPEGGVGHFIEVNHVACERLGYTREELLRMSPLDIDAPASRERVAGLIQQLLLTGRTLFEAVHVTKDGRRIPVEISSHVFDLHGQKMVLSIARDLTERKHAEQALQLQNAALTAAANAIVITDTKGTIEWANPAFTAFTGFTVTEARGKNPRDLIKSGQHPAEFYKELWDTILAGRVWRGEMVNRRKDGALYTEDMTITPLRDNAGVITHFIAIKQDITERKNLEAHLLRTQRLESVGRLASGVAHDLNNILAPILLSPALLREAIADPEARSLVDTIEQSAQRGAEIVKQLLTFGRGLKGERIPLQLRTLVREMLKLMRETFPKDITVHTQLPAEVPLVTGDATQLHQILMNLCVNARDAMPAGGELKSGLDPGTLDAAAAAAIPGARPGSFVVLGVGDNGTGIAAENLDKIFDPFFTTKPIGEGTGLGLSTVLGIVRSHAGFVQVQTAPGQGTQFRIYLPVAEKDAAVQPAAQAAPHVPGQGELVLVVDDEEHLRQMTRRFLEKSGYRVIEAQDGLEALQMLETLRELPRVVVTDFIMPRMDGPTLIRTLREKKIDVKIIGLGGLPPPPDILQALGLTPQTFIAKPFTSATLLGTLRAVLA